MAYKNFVDLHLHSDNSCDGHDSIMYFCEQAIAKGIRALAVTDHAECQRYFRDKFPVMVRYSHFETKKATVAFRGQLAVIAGLELAQPLHDLAAAEDALNANPLDFVIGSLHCVRDHDDFSNMDLSGKDVDSLLMAYYTELYEMVQWGRFDTLGHYTYPLRYIEGKYKIPVDLSRYREVMDETLHLLAEKGMALELNTQGYRTEYGKPAPDLSILRRFRELGGKYVTIGSDAHYAPDVGAGVQQGMELLQQAGFEYITLYDRHEPMLLEIR